MRFKTKKKNKQEEVTRDDRRTNITVRISEFNRYLPEHEVEIDSPHTPDKKFRRYVYRAITLFVQRIGRARTHRTNNNSPVRLISTPHFGRRMTSSLCTYVRRGICLRANLQLTAQTFRPRALRPAITARSWPLSRANIRQKIICFRPRVYHAKCKRT